MDGRGGAFALDDVITVKSIVAGDSYVDAAVNPEHVVSMMGVSPNPPTDVANTTYGMEGYNCWHTSGKDNSKAWLLLDLGDDTPIESMYIWNLNQRYGSKERDAKDIKITYSADGSEGSWTELGDYVVPQSKGNGEPCLPQLYVPFFQNARYIKVQILSSYGHDFWGLGKIILTRNSSGVGGKELAELNFLCKQHSQYTSYEYTQASWDRLQTALANANKLIDESSTDVDAILKATDALLDAVKHLEKKVDLMKGAVVSSYSFYGPGYEPSNMNDGNKDTRWASANLVDSVSVYIDLKESQTFNQMMIFENNTYGNRIAYVEAKVSNDGTGWSDWHAVAANSNQMFMVGRTVTARYLHVTFYEIKSGGINVDELMLFNDPEAEETERPVGWRTAAADGIVQTPALQPNIYQVRKAQLKYGMFIHYGINTFLGQEWSDGSADPSNYNPDLLTLDPDSWVKTAYEGGMNFIILVTKHHDGFAIWNTKLGTYNINHTGREGDKRDIVKEVADACRKYGIKLGLYYSAWDRNWDANNTTESTGLDRIRLAQKYNDYMVGQITELLDGTYGEISELWIDGAWEKPNVAWEFGYLYDIVKHLQPSCQMAINCTINGTKPDEWQGGEELVYFPSDFRLQDPFFTRPGADADPKIYKYKGNEYYLPFEATICINNTWFGSENNSASTVLSPERIKEAYNHMVEQDNSLVVNLGPSKKGLFNDFDVKNLYAGARALGIARGSARAEAEEGECVVRIEYVTSNNTLVWPTTCLYGQNGETFMAEPLDLRMLGYNLADGQEKVSGVFGQDVTVRFVYEDLGNIPSSVQTIASEHWLDVNGNDLLLSNVSDGVLNVYAADGRCIATQIIPVGGCRILLPTHHGVCFVTFDDGKDVKRKKIILP